MDPETCVPCTMDTEPLVVAKRGGNEFSPELLRVYYARLFPYELMTKWLSNGNGQDIGGGEIHGEKDYFFKREWCFTIEDDIYIRYNCFRNAAELEAAIQKRQPHKIDIGAIYTYPPKDHTTIAAGKFKTVERELVFDIDLTDYDDVRTCCTGAKICPRCWKYMTMAVKVVDSALRDDFGFQHILWVYSGRRGVHCWVSDKVARELTDNQRSQVVEYLSVLAGNDSQSEKCKLQWPLHPSLARAFSILEPMFRADIIGEEGQGLLASEEQWETVVKTLPEGLQEKVRQHWAKSSTLSSSPEDKWEALLELSGGGEKAAKKPKAAGAKGALHESWKVQTVFTHCYPRLDVNVSKCQNHLLKSPWCIHPKTGRVCVCFDPRKAETFDPEAVPTVGVLCDQIDAWDKAHSAEEAKATKDWQKTSLAGPLAFFEKSFLGPLYAGIRRERRDQRDADAAVTVDF